MTKNELAINAAQDIIDIAKPGDIINFNSTLPLSPKAIPLAVAYGGIKAFQMWLFGTKSTWKDVHTTIYFGPDQVASTEPPATKYISVRDFSLWNITIYRFHKRVTKKDAKNIMQSYFEKNLLGTPYDYLQLLDIAMTSILGDPAGYKRIVGLSKQNVVCSVAAYLVYREYCKKKKYPVIFSKPNKKWNEVHPNWTAEMLDNFLARDDDDYNSTSPAHFANSDFFSNEFKLVAEFNKGRRIY